MRVVRHEEIGSSGSEGNFARGLATPAIGGEETSVILQRQDPGAVNPFHKHDREEVMVMLSGTVRVTTGENEDTLLFGGDTLILPSGTLHRIQNEGDDVAEWIIAAPAGVRFVFEDGREASPEWAK